MLLGARDEALLDAGALLGATDETAADELPPTMPYGAGWAAQVEAAIQLALFSQPQPLVVVWHKGHRPWPYQLHCRPDTGALLATDDTAELAGTLEIAALDTGALDTGVLDAALDVTVPVALYTSNSAMPGALVAFTIRLIFLEVRCPRFSTFPAPMPVPVA